MTDSAFGARVRQAQAARGLTSDDLRRAFNVSNATIYNWRSGTTKPGRQLLLELAHVLEVDPSWLSGSEATVSGDEAEHAAGSATAAIVAVAASSPRPGRVLGEAIRRLHLALEGLDDEAQIEGWGLVCGHAEGEVAQ